MDMIMELTPELVDTEYFEIIVGEGGKLTWDITRSFLAYNYNQPVSIVLPPETEEFIEISSP